MASPQYEEELLSSVASFSPTLSPKSGIIGHPNHVSEPISTTDLILTPDPTLPTVQPCSFTQTPAVSTVSTQPVSSTFKTRH